MQKRKKNEKEKKKIQLYNDDYSKYKMRNALLMDVVTI